MHVFRGLQNPQRCHWSDEFQKKSGHIFFGNSCSRDFGATDCYQSTLIDLANTALASRDSVKTICMVCEGYRTQRGVTGPMNFKSRTFFYGKSCSRVFGAPGCHPSTLIDLANKALASNGFVKAICLLSEGYRNQRGVTGPMNFKKRRFFFGNSCSRDIGVLAAIQTI